MAFDDGLGILDRLDTVLQYRNRTDKIEKQCLHILVECVQLVAGHGKVAAAKHFVADPQISQDKGVIGPWLLHDLRELVVDGAEMGYRGLERALPDR